MLKIAKRTSHTAHKSCRRVQNRCPYELSKCRYLKTSSTIDQFCVTAQWQNVTGHGHQRVKFKSTVLFSPLPCPVHVPFTYCAMHMVRAGYYCLTRGC